LAAATASGLKWRRSWSSGQRGAARRKLGHARPDRRLPRGQVLGFLSEPPVEIGTAAVARRRRSLVVAFGLAARAGEPDVDMVVVSPPWADALQPSAIGAGLAAQRALDGGIDEDAFHLGPARNSFEQAAVLPTPH